MAKKNEVQQVPEIAEIYTNSVQVLVSPYEFLLQLGLETSGEGKPNMQHPDESPACEEVGGGIDKKHKRI